MIKHDGVYWYRKNREWRQFERKPYVNRGGWPEGYQRATCKRCGRRIVQRVKVRYCSERCHERDQVPCEDACPSCGQTTLSKRFGRYCSRVCLATGPTKKQST